MATTYTWNVSTVDTYPTHTDENDVTENDVIFNVHWRMSADDKNQSNRVYWYYSIKYFGRFFFY